jgi:hypothetical protein
MRIARLALLAAALLGVACSSGKAPADRAAAVQPAPPPAQKTVLDAQLKALDQAKAVQDTLEQQKQAADRKLEEAGG